MEGGIRAAEAALIIDFENPEAWYQLFLARYRDGSVDRAVQLAMQVIPRLTDPERIFFPIGRALHHSGAPDAAASIYEAILATNPGAREVHSEYLIYKQLCSADDSDAFAEFERWNTQFVHPILRSSKSAMTSRELDRPLRIAFVSNDFGGNHSLNSAMVPWFLHKERRRNSYIFYSNRPNDGADHKLFLDSADSFVNIFGLSDEKTDLKIREDRVDILVDMIGHMENNRLLTYARKPAPIIVSWIGIGIPTGIEAVDYFLADEIRVPRASLNGYREKVVYFPGTAMAWCPPKTAPAVAESPVSMSGRITFGNLTRIVKIQRETVALWARVLERVPGSTFLLKDHKLTGHNLRRLSAMFEECGISAQRLIFRPGSSQAEHLATYNEIDIVLDCFPQQGGVSSLEALWMGVPVISYCHSIKPAGRVGRFILENIGLSSLAVDTPGAYVELGAFLAGHVEQLSQLRAGLRRRLARSPLCDVEGFQRHVDAAFAKMWEQYCQGYLPESFTVDGA